MLMKRAFEHEKDELLREIERKDKMLFELTKIMKEEYLNRMERQVMFFYTLFYKKTFYKQHQAQICLFYDHKTLSL